MGGTLLIALYLLSTASPLCTANSLNSGSPLCIGSLLFAANPCYCYQVTDASPGAADGGPGLPGL